MKFTKEQLVPSEGDFSSEDVKIMNEYIEKFHPNLEIGDHFLPFFECFVQFECPLNCGWICKEFIPERKGTKDCKNCKKKYNCVYFERWCEFYLECEFEDLIKDIKKILDYKYIIIPTEIILNDRFKIIKELKRSKGL